MIIAIAAVGPNKELVRTIDKIYSDFEHEAIFEVEVGDKRAFIGYNAWTHITEHEKLAANGKVSILVDPEKEVPVDLLEETKDNDNFTIMTTKSFTSLLELGVLGEKEDIYILGGEKVFRETYYYWDKLFLAVYKEPQQSKTNFPFLDLGKKFVLVYEKEYNNFIFKDYISLDWIYGQGVK